MTDKADCGQRPLIFISYGMTKCGSTFGFRLARQALEMAGHDQSLIPLDAGLLDDKRRINFVPGLDFAQSERLLQVARDRNSSIALKIHQSPGPALEEMLRNDIAVGHAIFRDPRDMALSLLDAGERARNRGREAFAGIVTLDDAIAAVRRQLGTLQQWLELPGIVPLDYEDVVFHAEIACSRIMEQLGITGDEVSVVNAVRNSKSTQLNKGIPCRYLQEMSAADSTRIMEEFAPTYERLRKLAGIPQQLP